MTGEGKYFAACKTARVFFGSRSRSLFLLFFVFSIILTEKSLASTFPPGFSETILFSNLTRPTAIRFSPDGRIFVAEKRGYIKVYDGLLDTTAVIFADLRLNVQDYWDRGLLGLALDPNFPETPFVYVFYTYDFDPFTGTPAPLWGDTCNDPPGGTDDGCVVNGRISRLEIAPDNTMVGSEYVLLENNWCQQFPSHSIGALAFGPEGALYATAGDGASFNNTDYGQMGGDPGSPTPANPCDDPPVPRGTVQVPPAAEGGGLRSQDIRSTGDPLSYDGTVLRIDPQTGAAWPSNPLIGGIPEDDRIVGYGLRNPFRFTIRPGTDQVWIGDVGWGTWEEVNKLANPNVAPITNFGWPCYEGAVTQSGYDSTNLNLCESLYAQGSATPPFYAYDHSFDVDPNGDGCRTGGSSISGIAFYTGADYPAAYQDGLFFADYSRDCIYIIKKGVDGEPDLSTRTAFGIDVANPVDLQVGPGGDLYFVDYSDTQGRIRRITYSTLNQPPVALAAANPTSGQEPLTVQFDGSGSTDPNPGATLFYKWDLDADGQYDDSSIVDPTFTYTTEASVTVGLQVTDDDGASDTDQIVITVGNTAPTATILNPSSSTLWKVGDQIFFSGQGDDPEDGVMPASSMSWEVIMHHCPSGGGGGCHLHPIQDYDFVASGNFPAPDHEYPSYLEFRLTVIDSGGLTGVASVNINPIPVQLTFESNPTGAAISAGDVSGTTTFSRNAIVNSTISISATTPQLINNTLYYFVSWSDGGAQSHDIVAPATPQTFIATFAPCVAPSESVPLTVSKTQISWNAIPEATSYDIVRGDLQALQTAGGNFTPATQQCIANNQTGTSLSYSANPGPDQVSWFLARGVSCGGNGSYASSGAGQHHNPDAEINASPNACP